MFKKAGPERTEYRAFQGLYLSNSDRQHGWPTHSTTISPTSLLACRDLYDEPVAQAGSAYVSDIDPTVETLTFSDTDLQAVKNDIATAMNRIVEISLASTRLVIPVDSVSTISRALRNHYTSIDGVVSSQ